VTSDGKSIIWGSEIGAVNIFRADSSEVYFRKPFSRRKVGITSVAVSPDGKSIISGGRNNIIKGWDFANCVEIPSIPEHPADSNGEISGICVAFSPDGRCLASGGLDKVIRIWDASSGLEKTLPGHENWISSLVYSPNGRRIVSGSGDATVKIWDVESGKEIKTLQQYSVKIDMPLDFKQCVCVAFSPDGKLIVSGGPKGDLKIWDSENCTKLMTLRGHEGPVQSVAYSPDGKYILSGGLDKTVRVWEPSRPPGQRNISILQGHTNWVFSVAFSPDGKRFVSGGNDDTIKVWDAVEYRELLTLRGHLGPVRSVVFSPDGTKIISGGLDHCIRVWKTD
jgi:WD40 repeat protein